jgi:dTDP-4-amino-4,6-dideoxygalactose transaminase
MKVEFYKHNLNEQDFASVIEALKQPILTTGQKVADFEAKFSEYTGCKYTVGVTSCTAALHLSLLAHGIGQGDEVITTPMTFIATATSIIQAGARPVFVDVEKTTGNIDAKLIENAITAKTKAIIPVHLYGTMCNMREIRRIADKYHLIIIEDVAHAPEASRDGVKPGQLGDTACYSYFATKAMTCFPEGTIVAVKPPFPSIRGSSRMKKIEDIKIGDLALTYDETTADKEYRSVVQTFCRDYEGEMINFVFSNKNRLSLTPEHPVYVIGKGWVKAEDVAHGDQVIQYLYRGLAWIEIATGKKLSDILGEEKANESNRKTSETVKARYQDPNSRWQYMYTDEWKNKIRIGNTKPCTEDRRKHSIAAGKKRWDSMSEEDRRKFCEKMQEVVKDPEVKKRQIEGTRKNAKNPEVRKKLSEGVKRAMLKDSYWDNYIKGMNMKPNKPEQFLLDFLTKSFPGEFNYNGDYRMKVRIDRLIPDFVHINGKRKVIDVVGSYWHSDKEVESRHIRYRIQGWDSLMLREKDLKDKDQLYKRILTFLYNPHIKIVEVVSKSRHIYKGKVYNINTKDNHNYFARGILVHNCGEGGAVCTNNKEIADKIRIMRSHGMTAGANERFQKRYKHWDMTEFGWKFNMDNIQAALLINQVDRMYENWECREQISRFYEQELKGVVGYPATVGVSGRHLFTIWHDERDEMIGKLQDAGIGITVNYRAIHLLTYFRNRFGFKAGAFPIAEWIGDRTLSLPLYPKLTDEEVEYVVKTVKASA